MQVRTMLARAAVFGNHKQRWASAALVTSGRAEIAERAGHPGSPGHTRWIPRSLWMPGTSPGGRAVSRSCHRESIHLGLAAWAWSRHWNAAPGKLPHRG